MSRRGIRCPKEAGLPRASAKGEFFDAESMRFLRDLRTNNNREWFQKNKGRYESAVQAPAVRFIEAAGPRLAKLSPHIVADARPFGGSLSRIYRDTRFSKDKSPYKTAVGIHFAHDNAAKGENRPGYFLHIAPGESMVASGIWHPPPPDLTKIRNAIASTSGSWGKVLKRGLELGGESYARVPAGFDPNHRYAVDLRRKDFYAFHHFADSVVARPGFLDEFDAACRDLEPLNEFLARATGVPW
jgi:uncharacterized protein (TIGR02453 family)